MRKIIVAILMAFMVCSVSADPTLVDLKYCGFVTRTEDGLIIKSLNEPRKFQLIHPCPATGMKIGACPGWTIDYVIPLSCGGCDAVVNMQWMPVAAKTCTEDFCKDRYEKLIQFPDPNMPGYKKKTCSVKLMPMDE